MRPISGSVRVAGRALPALLVLLLAALAPVSAQNCLAPTLDPSTDCQFGILHTTLTAAEDYDFVTLRVLDSTFTVVDEISSGPIISGGTLDLVSLLPYAFYTIEGIATCPSLDTVSEQVGYSHDCPVFPFSVNTMLELPIPGETSRVSISVVDNGDRVEQVLQTWTGAAFDLSGFAPGATVGTAYRISSAGYDMVFDISVALVGPTAVFLDFTVVSVSPAFLSFLTSLGAGDPTGLVLGSMGIAASSPLGTGIGIEVPDPLPSGSMWVSPTPWDLFIDLTPAFVELPLGLSTVTLESDVEALLGGGGIVTQVVPIGSPASFYVPSISTVLASTATGASTTFTQITTDDNGDQFTHVQRSEFGAGSFALGSFSAGQVCGSWHLDFLLPGVMSGQTLVTAPGTSTLRAALMVDFVNPTFLNLILQAGFPNPLGTAVYTLEYENLPGGGARVTRAEQSVFPVGQTAPLVADFIFVVEHLVPLVLPAIPGILHVESELMSQLGEFAFFGEDFPIGGGGGGGFERGDCNADGGYDIGDAIFTLAALFSGGTTPACADACDSNDDGANDIGDPIWTLAALFSGGALPPAPRGACGSDPSADGIGCAAYPPCP